MCFAMHIFNKIALFFVVFFSVVIILNTYIGEMERAQSNVVYLLMNGFAYIASAMEVDRERQGLKEGDKAVLFN
jgi:hypothetical protein